MDFHFGALIAPAALLLGAPENAGTFEKGLFCETVALVERVASLAERGADPVKAVADLNRKLDRRACIYAVETDVRAETVGFERTLTANKTEYAIYQVRVTAFGHQMTEVGDFSWKLSHPLTMYTLRAAAEPARKI